MLKESLMINRSLLQLGLASTGITCEGRNFDIAFLPLSLLDFFFRTFLLLYN